jgi:hypothetical protein
LLIQPPPSGLTQTGKKRTNPKAQGCIYKLIKILIIVFAKQFLSYFFKFALDDHPPKQLPKSWQHTRLARVNKMTTHCKWREAC